MWQVWVVNIVGAGVIGAAGGAGIAMLLAWTWDKLHALYLPVQWVAAWILWKRKHPSWKNQLLTALHQDAIKNKDMDPILLDLDKDIRNRKVGSCNNLYGHTWDLIKSHFRDDEIEDMIYKLQNHSENK
jgi:hypothetical protein